MDQDIDDIPFKPVKIKKYNYQQYQKEYHKKNIKRLREYNKKKYLQNRGERLKYQKEYYQKNKEKLKSKDTRTYEQRKKYIQEYRIKNKDRLKEQRIKRYREKRNEKRKETREKYNSLTLQEKQKRYESHKKWLAKNPGYCAKAMKKYRLANKEKVISRIATVRWVYGKVVGGFAYPKIEGPKEECFRCGIFGVKLQLHHEVYPTKKEDIIEAIKNKKIYFLCEQCHQIITKKV